MKKIVYLITAAVLIGIVAVSLMLLGGNDETVTDNITPTAAFDPQLSSTEKKKDDPGIISADEYKSSWILIRDLKKLRLVSNLAEKMTTKEAKDEYGCSQISSASYWAEDIGHLGLFVSDSEIINESSNSKLINGYFWVDRNGANISRTKPELNGVDTALQTGPILFYDNQQVKIQSENNENSRRLILATNSINEAMIISIYYSANPLLGPKLTELPGILEKMKNNTSLNFDKALNLDGGSHSAFISDSLTLTEISPVGAFFCILP